MSTKLKPSKSSPSSNREPMTGKYLGGLVATLVLAWLLMLAPLPYSLLAGLVALIGLAFLVLTLMRSGKEKRRGTALLAAILAGPALGIIIVGSLSSLVFYGPMREAQECRDTAITERAKSQCQQDLESSTQDWVRGLFGG